MMDNTVIIREKLHRPHLEWNWSDQKIKDLDEIATDKSSDAGKLWQTAKRIGQVEQVTDLVTRQVTEIRDTRSYGQVTGENPNKGEYPSLENTTVDCSEFVRESFIMSGLTDPGRDTLAQREYFETKGQFIKTFTPKLGDVIFWEYEKKGGKIGRHVAIVTEVVSAEKSSKMIVKAMNAQGNGGKPGSIREAIINSDGSMWGTHRFIGIGRLESPKIKSVNSTIID